MAERYKNDRGALRRKFRVGQFRLAAGSILILHTAALVWGAWCHSPTGLEVRLLASGVSCWHLHRFDLYRVNPPLVPLCAALPVLALKPHTDWSNFSFAPGSRPDYVIAKQFADANGIRILQFVRVGRLVCIPFSLLGACGCLLWARELYGRRAALIATALWCFSPNVLAHGQLISTDAAAAALGVCAGYTFWRWLRRPNWLAALVFGTVMGIAETTKTTWILMPVLWPSIWASERLSSAALRNLRILGYELAQMVVALCFAVYVLNTGYAFERTCERIGQHVFVSHALRSNETTPVRATEAGNRFTGSAVGRLRLPLPTNYLVGLDLQQREFERRQMSYLRGRWQSGGWWYYYLYGLFVKTSLGTLVLLTLACVTTIVRARSLRDELVLLAPCAALLIMVSLQTGFSHHVRYVLPVLPFAFIWISKTGLLLTRHHTRISLVVVGALVGSFAGTVSVYPHALSFFNCLAGGPRNGAYHLLHSNVDWGQDILYLKRWYNDHPEARPLQVALCTGTSVDFSLVEATWRVLGQSGHPGMSTLGNAQPGWYAISVNRLRDHTRRLSLFTNYAPVATAGYSICIYHITLEDANYVRRKLGLPKLPSDWERKGNVAGDNDEWDAVRRASDQPLRTGP